MLPLLAEIDPTNSGEYVPWLLKLVKTKDVRLPEDAEKLNELLVVFHHYKRRFPPELRDINRYKSHADLYKAIRQLFPTTDDGLVLDENFKLVGEVPPYSLYEVTDRKTVQKMGKNTNWCTKAKEVAEEYLKQGPLYLILMNGEKFGQVHFETAEVKDLENKTIASETGLLRRLLKSVGERYYYLIDWLNEEEKQDFAKWLLARVAQGEVINDTWENIYKLEVITDSELRLFTTDCAERVIHDYELYHPNDHRPRLAIETAREFALGLATPEELAMAGKGARIAAESSDFAARSAAWSATYSAASGLDAKAVAMFAARSAYWSAADSVPQYVAPPSR